LFNKSKKNFNLINRKSISYAVILTVKIYQFVSDPMATALWLRSEIWKINPLKLPEHFLVWYFYLPAAENNTTRKLPMTRYLVIEKE